MFGQKQSQGRESWVQLPAPDHVFPMTPHAYYIVAAAWIVYAHVRWFVLASQKPRPVPGEPGYKLPRETTSRGVIEARLSPEGEIASWVPVGPAPKPDVLTVVMGKHKREILRH